LLYSCSISRLPDGNGIDFLHEVWGLQPDARAVVVTGNPLPVYRERTAALGGIRFFEKPVPAAALVEALRELLETKGRAAPANAFHGTIRNLSVIDLLQLKCMASATTVIRFQSPSGEGRVFFEQGRVVYAETARATGEEALAEIVAFTGGKVVEEPFRTVTPTLHQEWQTLLMNAAYTQDMRAAEAQGARRSLDPGRVPHENGAPIIARQPSRMVHQPAGVWRGL
jgi:hypothetical protein